jgi:hypothetical protein
MQINASARILCQVSAGFAILPCSVGRLPLENRRADKFVFVFDSVLDVFVLMQLDDQKAIVLET